MVLMIHGAFFTYFFWLPSREKKEQACYEPHVTTGPGKDPSRKKVNIKELMTYCVLNKMSTIILYIKIHNLAKIHSWNRKLVSAF